MSWAEVKMAVKSIQRGYTNVTNEDVTVTLGKAVDPSRCIVLLDGNCGMYNTSSSRSYSVTHDDGFDSYYKSWDGSYTVTEYYGLGYAAARKPFLKALTATQLTIGQSGTYSSNGSGTVVSYQVIEFFN